MKYFVCLCKLAAVLNTDTQVVRAETRHDGRQTLEQ